MNLFERYGCFADFKENVIAKKIVMKPLWKDAYKMVGHIRRITFHFAAICTGLLINTGFPLKDVQKWIGHVDIQMTTNIYGHLDVSQKQSMASRLSGSLLE